MELLPLMNTGSSWSEVRWKDRQPSPLTTTSLMNAPNRASDRTFLQGPEEGQHSWSTGPLGYLGRDMPTPKAEPSGPSYFPHKTVSDNRLNGSSDMLPRDTYGFQHPQSASSLFKSEDRLADPNPGHPERAPRDDRIDSRDASRSRRQSTFLPSFASLQHSGGRERGSTIDVEATLVVDKPSCRGCNERTSAIEDIAIAVSGFEEVLQKHQLRSFVKRSDAPRNDSLRTARWVLDCLQHAKTELQGPLALTSMSYRSYNSLEHTPTVATPPDSIKRLSDDLDEDAPLGKRPRTMLNTVQGSVTSAQFEEQRRASESLQRSEHYRTHSPAHSESWTTSAHHEQQSPRNYGQSLRPLPSPSSMATTSYKTPWSGTSAPPGLSPTLSNRATSSIHTASTTSAASQHIADLQHQVTLKSLALQTLQAEYTSLLQKFQRDRLKSQTLDKKSIAAEQEVNDLTSKNEELSEQVKTLEAQVEQSEKRRESERSESLREKEQWGRMLEMSSRLQAKNANERQKITRERDELQQKLAALGGNAIPSLRVNPPERHSCSDQRANGRNDQEGQEELAILRHDNSILQTKVSKLRDVLKATETYFAGMMDQRRAILEKEEGVTSAIAGALRDDVSPPRTFPSELLRQNHSPSAHEVPRGSADQPATRWPSSAQRPSSSEAAAEPLSSASSKPQTTTPPNSHPIAQKSNTPDFANNPPTNRSPLPLPKWQPPNQPSLFTTTETLPNNQRRPSGPSTPYPGSEHLPWQSSNMTTSPLPIVPTTKSSSQRPLPIFGTEKVPAANYIPQFAPPPSSLASQVSANGTRTRGAEAEEAMPPPPRPGC